MDKTRTMQDILPNNALIPSGCRELGSGRFVESPPIAWSDVEAMLTAIRQATAASLHNGRSDVSRLEVPEVDTIDVIQSVMNVLGLKTRLQHEVVYAPVPR